MHNHQCDGCGVQIPANAQKFVSVGGVQIPFPFCETCEEELRAKRAAYQKDKPRDPRDEE